MSKTKELSARWHAWAHACETLKRCREAREAAESAMQEYAFGCERDAFVPYEEARWAVRDAAEQEAGVGLAANMLLTEYLARHDAIGGPTGTCECDGCVWFRSQYYCCGVERFGAWCGICGEPRSAEAREE